MSAETKRTNELGGLKWAAAASAAAAAATYSWPRHDLDC